VRIPALLIALVLAPATGARGAEPLTAEQVARVRRDEAAALARVDAAHGHRKPSQMSPEERRQVIAEQSAATQEALSRNGVDAKAYARHSARLSPAQEEEVAAQLRCLEAEAARPRRPEQAPGEIQIEHGTPVSMEPAPEQSAAGEIPVEYGTPVELPAGELPAGE
jgi:hypothetical protein